MIRFGVIGLAVTAALLFSPVMPWALDFAGLPQEVIFTVDSILMPGVVLFLLVTVFGLVRRYGR